jgi:hypothetical protein
LPVYYRRPHRHGSRAAGKQNEQYHRKRQGAARHRTSQPSACATPPVGEARGLCQESSPTIRESRLRCRRKRSQSLRDADQFLHIRIVARRVNLCCAAGEPSQGVV